MTLRIGYNWVDAGRSVDRISEATMADLTISLDDESLTAHVDHKHRSYRESVTVPLYPLAQWAVTWWWPLFYEFGEERRLDPERDADYFSRHDLALAGAGFVYPSVVFRPTGKMIVVWSRRLRRAYSPLDYLTEKSSVVDSGEVQQEFTHLIGAVLERLRDVPGCDDPLFADWEAICSADEKEKAFCRAAGGFGLDPYEITDLDATRICCMLDSVPAAWRDDLFSLGSPCDTVSALPNLRKAENDIQALDAGDAWKRIKPDLMSGIAGALPPYEIGFQMARAVREALCLDGEPIAFEGDRRVPHTDLGVAPGRLIGIVSADSPACAIRHGAPETTRRFAEARAVGSFLFNRGNRSSSLLTTMSTDAQAVTRSFAAEFLAPESGLRRECPALGDRGRVSLVVVHELSEKFGVSEFVIRHQIRNHELGFIDDEQDW